MPPDVQPSIPAPARSIKEEMRPLDSDPEDEVVKVVNGTKWRPTNRIPISMKLEASADNNTNDDNDENDDDDDDDNDDDDVEDDFDVDSFDGETEEMFDDALPIGISEDTCCQAEAALFRQQLRNIGPAEFCRITVEAGVISAKKLLTAFGMRPPLRLAGQPDEAYYQLLSLAISKELSKRVKLPHFNTVNDAVALIKAAKNIIVLTGAGISTSLGIPDFRSKQTGLYSKLQHLGLSDPQEVFDINLFRRDPTIFYSIAKDILPDTRKFTPTHAFIALLQQKGKLLTNYSQNIDNIESAAGILPEKLIQCHGSFASATCIACQWKIPLTADSYVYQEMKKKNVPKCRRCIERLRLRPAVMKRKRSQNGQDKKRKKTSGYPHDGDTSDEDNEYDYPTAGVMKPDIIFFGEALPDTFSERLTNHDKHKVDLVIVIGTSLKVAPVSEVIPYLPANIPQMYISREPVSHVNFDIDLLGDCDVVVAELCRRAGWELKHDMIPKGQEVNVSVAAGYQSRLLFTEKKQAS